MNKSLLGPVRAWLFFCVGVFMSVSVNTAASALSEELDPYLTPSVMNQVALSSSGELIAYVTVQSQKRIVRVLNLETKEEVVSIDGDDLDIRRLRFITDRFLVIDLATVAPLTGYGRVALHSLIRVDLTDGSIEYVLERGKRGVNIYQADLTRIVGVDFENDRVLMPVRMEVGRKDRVVSRLLSVSLEDPTDFHTAENGLNDVENYWVGADGEVLAQETFNDDDDLHRIWVRRDGDWVPIYESHSAVRIRQFTSLTHDYSGITFVEWDNSGYITRRSMSLEDGTVSEFSDRAAKRSIDSYYDTPDGRFLGAQFAGFTPSYYFADRLLNRIMQQVTLEFEGQVVDFVGWSERSRRLLVRISGSEFTGIYVMFEPGVAPVLVGSAFPNVDAARLSAMGIESLKARDGLEIPTIVVTPSAHQPSPAPLVVMPHGGPSSYDRLAYDALAQYFASRGAMVIKPQFRGSTVDDYNFYAAGFGEWAGAMQSDVFDVLQSLIDQGRVDPSRVCIVGSSYGGYTALMNAAYYGDAYQCAVSINGVANLKDQLVYDRRYFGRNSEAVHYMENNMFGGELDSSVLLDASPVSVAERITASVLLIHSEEDFRVPVEQSREMYSALRSADAEVELIELENDGHTITNIENQALYLRRVTEFVTEHLGL